MMLSKMSKIALKKSDRTSTATQSVNQSNRTSTATQSVNQSNRTSTITNQNSVRQSAANQSATEPRDSLMGRLSLLAGFDDVCRDQNGLIQVNESALRELIRKCETNRIESLLVKRELAEETRRFEKLSKDNKHLKASTISVRKQYAKELSKQEDMKIEIKELSKSLKNIKEFVSTELSTNQSMDESTEQLVTFIKELDTIEEKTEDSLNDLSFDKSEEFN